MSAKQHPYEKWDSVIPIPNIRASAALLLISAAAYLSYSKSLNATFVFDDHEAVINNKDVISSQMSMYDLFFHDFWGASITHRASHKSYRPLTVLCFRLLYQLSGGKLNPFVFHCVNITVHMVVSCLTFVVYNIIFEMHCPKSAFLCALFFAVHPVHTESVVGVVGQAELLSAFFALLSFIVFHYGCASKRSLLSTVAYSLASCVLSIVAMLCKEQGITIIKALVFTRRKSSLMIQWKVTYLPRLTIVGFMKNTGVIIVYDLIIVNKLTVGKILELFSSVLKIVMNGNFSSLLKMFNYCEFADKYPNKANGFKYHSKLMWAGRNVVVIPVQLCSLTTMITRNAVLILATGIALYIRWLLMGSTLPVFQKIDNPASFEESFFYRVLNYNYIYLINTWILLCPEWLCFDWSMGCVPLIKADASKIDFRIGFVFAFWFAVCCLIYSTYKSAGVTQRTLTLGLSSTLILFSPASNIFFKVGFVVAERVLYLPSLGYFLVLIVGLQKLATFEQYRKVGIITKSVTDIRNMCGSSYPYHLHYFSVFESRNWLFPISKWALVLKQLLQFAMVSLVVIFSLRSIHRTEDWLTEKQLFESALSVCPLNAKVHYNLAKNSADRGLKEYAIRHYEEAIRLHPKYDLAMNNLANIYRDEGNLAKAEKLLITALEIRPDFSTAWMNLGIVYSSMGVLNDSEICYLEALKYRKRYPDCFYNLGNLYLELERNSDALAAWRNATSLKPTHKIAWSNLIVMLDSMGRLSEALNESYNALSYLPNEPNIHFNLANVLGKLNEYGESEKHFLRAIRLNPSMPTYHYNLGVLYHRWNKFCEAKFHYVEAYKLDSGSKAKKQLNLLKRSGKIDHCRPRE